MISHLKLQQTDQLNCYERIPRFSRVQLGNRTSQRVYFDGQCYQLLMLEIERNFAKQIQVGIDVKNLIANKESQLQQQFDLQEKIQSQYVIKNIQYISLPEAVTFLQQDYICTLSDFEVHKLNLAERLEIFLSIAKGVKDLQQNLVCHRSLNPLCICMTKQEGKYIGKINLFEAAATMRGKHDRTSILNAKDLLFLQNTIIFASPQIRYAEAHGLATDIYSLGVIFNYLLYETTDNIYEIEKEIKVEFPEGTPQWLKNLAYSMLQFNPKKRWQIKNIIKLIQISMKCVDIMEKYIPFGGRHFKQQPQRED